MKVNKIIFAFMICVVTICSCKTTQGGAYSNNASQTPDTYIKSGNEYNLIVSPNSVTYTIDISTPEGRVKLNKLSLEEAKELALTEAAIQNGCALLVNPQYTYNKRGKRILRITVHGFPAKYKEAN